MATGIDKLPSGKYRARLFRDGRKVTVGTYDTLKEATLARARAMVNPDEERRGQTKFWKYAETHFNLQVSSGVWVKGTWENNVRSYNKYLAPYFGQKKLCDVSSALVKRWWVSMDDKPGPRRAAYMVLSGVMSAAEEDEEIIRWRGIKGASKDVSQVRPVAPVNDVKILTMLAADPQTATLLTVLLHSGLRIGEVLALNWEDFNGDSLHVNKHATRYDEKAPGRKRHPSYDGYQDLTGEAVRALEALKASRRSGPIFINNAGERLSYHAWWNRWDALRKAYGLQSINTHDIRSTHLTAYWEQGATDKEVMLRGGHTDYRSMLRYQRPSDDRQKQLVSKLAF